MSSPVSPVSAASPQDESLDVDHLITEVQTRTALWDKNSKSYSDRILKTRLWEEVCQNVIPNWDELTNEKKKRKGADIQKKWKNLKDCFARELAAQKKKVSGQSGKKKRKYYYFDQLSFLISVNTSRDTSSNVKSTEESTKTDIQSDETSSPQEQGSRQSINLRKKGAKSQKGNTEIDEELLDILRKKQKDFDEDISFAEMLVPMLRKLNDDQKLYAKMEVLNAMDRAKRYVPTSQLSYPRSTPTPQSIYPGYNKDSLYPNTSATYIMSEPGTSTTPINYVHPKNFVIHKNKNHTKIPQVQKNCTDFSNCNDYLQRFAEDLQSTDSMVSQDSNDYYDVTLASL